MTSIAVTASVCARTSEAALLVAFFMHSPWRMIRQSVSGLATRSFVFNINNAHERAIGHHPSWPAKARQPLCFHSEHPTTSIRFDESPLSEYRLFHGRTAMRRHLGSHGAGLCARDGILESIFRRVCVNGTRGRC